MENDNLSIKVEQAHKQALDSQKALDKLATSHRDEINSCKTEILDLKSNLDSSKERMLEL